MGKLVITTNMSLDGVVQDPDGEEGFGRGAGSSPWALKQQDGRDLLIWGHGLHAETLLKQHLLDVLDISIYPVVAGRARYWRH